MVVFEVGFKGDFDIFNGFGISEEVHRIVMIISDECLGESVF